MKPLELQLCNVGPFRKEKIDFEAMGQMFLLYGKTGSGKTTIFDAITFALYGDLLGERKQNSRDFKNQNAGEEEAWVSLTFSTGPETWRVRRTLPDKIISSRGNLRERPSSVSLEHKKSGETEFTAIEANTTEINSRLETIIGLSYGEFTRIVVLPQGAFAQFLRANSGAKKELLSKIFPVENIRAIQESVKTKAAGFTNQSLMIARQIEEFRLENDVDHFEAQIKATEEAKKLAENQSEEISLKRDSLLKAQHDLESEFDDAERFESLKETEKELLENKENIDEKRAILSKILEAEKILPWMTAKNKAQFRVNEAEKILLKAEAESISAQKAESALNEKLPETDAKKDQIASNNEKLVQLQKDQKILEDKENAEVMMQIAEKKLKEAAESAGKKHEEFADFFAEAAAGSDESENIADAASVMQKKLLAASENVSVCREKSAESAKLLADSKKAEQLKTDLAESDEELSNQKNTAEEWKNQKSNLEAILAEYKAEKEAQVRNNHAMFLAAVLEKGKPCPVCGSTEHPAPVKALAQVLDLDTKIATQEKAVLSAEKALNRECTILSELEGRIKQQTQNLADFLATTETVEINMAEEKLNSAKNAENQAQNDYDKLKKDSETLTLLQKNCDDADRMAGNAEKSFNTAKERLDTLTGQISDDIALMTVSQLKTIIQEKKSETDRLRQEVTDFEMALDKARIESAERKTAFAAAGENFSDAKKSAEEALEKFVRELASSPFDDESSLAETESLLTNKKQFQYAVEQWDASLAETQSKLKLFEDKTSRSSIIIRQELAASKEMLEKTNNEFAENKESISRLSAELQKITGLLQTFDKLEKQRLRLEKEGGSWINLHKALSGNNPRKVQFETWYLSHYFEEVVHYANFKFERISGGRYIFVLDTESSGGRAQHGLDLCVYDSYTGKMRDTATLSGGESFMASLCLALGLTEVMQAKGGGVRLDSLFIDEGFGSLDSESLNKAIEVLKNLGEERTVGVISHVEEMYQSIGNHIELIKETGGSKVSYSVAS